MGGDATSALYRELVVRRKLASDAGAAYSGYARDSGEFDVYAVPRPGVRLDVLEHNVDQIMQSFAQAHPQDRRSRARQDAARGGRRSIAATASIRWRRLTDRRWPSVSPPTT